MKRFIIQLRFLTIQLCLIGSVALSSHNCLPTEVTWPNVERGGYTCQSLDDARLDCYAFLFDNLMIYDSINRGSLGFPTIFLLSKEKEEHNDANVNDDSNSKTVSMSRRILTDGLENGIIGPTVELALQTRKYPWNRDVPKDIFMEYVLNFANVNEARSNWREFITEALGPLLDTLLDSDGEELSVEDVVMTLNHYLWSAFSGVTIEYKKGQTPLIYDPMSILAFGYTSCTGLSILFVDSLRCLGIPARIAGTPAWNGDPENGNHTWVEVYSLGEGWRVTEAAPAAGFVPSLSNPCDLWFCTKEKFDGKTKVYAARLRKETPKSLNFPMAW